MKPRVTCVFLLFLHLSFPLWLSTATWSTPGGPWQLKKFLPASVFCSPSDIQSQPLNLSCAVISPLTRSVAASQWQNKVGAGLPVLATPPFQIDPPWPVSLPPMHRASGPSLCYPQSISPQKHLPAFSLSFPVFAMPLIMLLCGTMAAGRRVRARWVWERWASSASEGMPARTQHSKQVLLIQKFKGNSKCYTYFPPFASSWAMGPDVDWSADKTSQVLPVQTFIHPQEIGGKVHGHVESSHKNRKNREKANVFNCCFSLSVMFFLSYSLIPSLLLWPFLNGAASGWSLVVSPFADLWTGRARRRSATPGNGVCHKSR